jgi:acetyl esterase/lipase
MLAKELCGVVCAVAEDPVAPARFTRTYADALTKHGVGAQVRVEPGLKHDILLERVVMEELRGLLGSVGWRK